MSIPRLKLPLKVVNGAFATVEQDSEADIQQCVTAVLRTRLGERSDLPNMGVVDPTFKEAPADVGALEQIVTRHEPRVSVSATSVVDAIDQALTDIGVNWQSATPEANDG